jgi:hypothetical protein
MQVEYAHCSECGMEWIDGVSLLVLGDYANGIFLQCPECQGSIGPGNYDEVAEDQD